MGFISELQRRNVLRGAIAYGVFSWIVIQVIDIVGPELALPDSALRVTLVTLAACFPFVLIFAWMFRWTPG